MPKPDSVAGASSSSSGATPGTSGSLQMPSGQPGPATPQLARQDSRRDDDKTKEELEEEERERMQ